MFVDMQSRRARHFSARHAAKAKLENTRQYVVASERPAHLVCHVRARLLSPLVPPEILCLLVFDDGHPPVVRLCFHPLQSLVTYSEDQFIRSAVAIATDVDLNTRTRELILANNHR